MCTECAHLLLAHNAPVKVKNAQGWSPLAEAISYGDRQMSKCQTVRNSPAAPQLHTDMMLLKSKWLYWDFSFGSSVLKAR